MCNSTRLSVQSFCCHILCFKMRHTFSAEERSGLRAGRSDIWAAFLNKTSSSGQHALFQISVYFPAFVFPSQVWKISLFKGTKTPDLEPWTVTDLAQVLLTLQVVLFLFFFFGSRYTFDCAMVHPSCLRCLSEPGILDDASGLG